MTISIVQSASGTGAGTSAVATLASTPVNGNEIIAIVRGTSILANNYNVSTGAGNFNFNAGELVASPGVLVFQKNASGDTSTVTATATGSTNTQLHVLEVAGLKATPFDQAVGSTGIAVTSLSTGTTPATTVDYELLIAAIAQFNTNGSGITWTNGFTALAETDRLITAWKIIRAVATAETTGGWTTARAASAILATYKGKASYPPVGPGKSIQHLLVR